MKTIIALVFSLTILSFASCVISGGRPRTRVQKYVEIDTSSNRVVYDSVEIFFKGQPHPKFAYDKVARITITGARYDYSEKLIYLLTKKAIELHCDAVVYVEFDNEERHYSTFNPFWDGESETITVLEITGLAVKKRISHRIDSITNLENSTD